MRPYTSTRAALAVLVAGLAALAPAVRAAEKKPLPKDLPPFGEDKPLPVPAIDKSQLPNGLSTWIVKRSGRCSLVWRRPSAYGALHVKFAASSMLPEPLYCATCGYGHSGRVRSTLPAVLCDAMMLSGALPCSTQRSSGPILSNVLGPSPPLQCAIPGAMKRRTLFPVAAAPPSVSWTLSKYLTVLNGETFWSFQPW